MWSSQVMPDWHRQGLYMGMHWLWWIFWVAVVLIVLWTFFRLGSDEHARRTEQHRSESAEEALRRRFGDGEIDEDEFVRRMQVIRESRRPTGRASPRS